MWGWNMYFCQTETDPVVVFLWWGIKWEEIQHNNCVGAFVGSVNVVTRQCQ